MNVMKRIEIPEYVPNKISISCHADTKDIYIIFVVDHHPYIPELSLVYDLKFVYSVRPYLLSEPIFQFDADPFGEGHPLDMLELCSSADYNEMKFGIQEEDSDFYHFNIKSKYPQHTIIQKAIVEVNKKDRKIEFKETDLDNVAISFEKGKITTLRVNSSNSGCIENCQPFDIIREKGEYILIQYRPDFKRTKLQGFFLHDHLIRCTHDEGEFSYQLNVNENIYSLLKELLENEGSWDI